jgi:hypothetical protein
VSRLVWPVAKLIDDLLLHDSGLRPPRIGVSIKLGPSSGYIFLLHYIKRVDVEIILQRIGVSRSELCLLILHRTP